MNPLSLVFMILLAGLVTWLMIDTIIAVVKKIKARKKDKDVETKE